MTCVLVVGVPRSGTSCVAGILHHLGIDMGDWQRFPANDMNPAGFFMDVGFQEIFDDLPLIPEPSQVTEAHREKVRARIAERAADGVPWGANFTHAALVADEFAGAGLITTSRPLDQSRASWEAWGGDPDDIDRAAKNIAAVTGERLTVDFDALLSDPATTVGQIAAFVGQPVTQAAIDSVHPALRRYS